jgi:hypothetical protein
MKGDAYVLVTGLMIAALANLPEIHSQGDAYTLYILQFTDSDSCNKQHLQICNNGTIFIIPDVY